MRTYSKLFLTLSTIFLFSCKDDTIKLLEDMSGNWKLDEIVYSKVGQTAPDSVVKYPNSIFQLNECDDYKAKICNGFYNLQGNEKVNIQYNASSSFNEASIFVYETKVPKIDLNGSYKVFLDGNSMTLKGPQASSPTYQGRTIELRLKK
ncbi:hypothetical protein [Arcicella rosea]|uniref:Lipocalin-like domain-containing protein n=1 Tax=Arcicella rosea TaxID=502909 RepID=A0A841EGL8_9BACT|nr:hypothetical protein [Arcicella rosea]MBB6003337.1 hypothetical protein [Arcicella rosea]